MNQDVLTYIIESLIGIAVVLVTTFVIPWIKNNIDAQKLQKFAYWVNIAVRAIEQKYKGQTGKGIVKKQEVINFLISTGILDNVDLTAEQDNIIESTVFDMNQGSGT